MHELDRRFQNAAFTACIALFDIQITFILPTNYIYVFHKILSLNIDCLPNNINSPAFKIHTYRHRKRVATNFELLIFQGFQIHKKENLT